jgi:predicted glycogen debranching enzyme
MIKLQENIVSNFAESASREWLETNGIGGYASGTVSGANTRRYHGLLVAATKPPLGRAVLLSKLEETVLIDGERFELSSNQYPGTVHPGGFRFLKSFRLDPFPIWTYLAGDVEIEKKLFMVHGENTGILSWAVKGRKKNDTRDVSLEIRPLLAFRDHHHLRNSAEGFDTDFSVNGETVSVKPSTEMPTLFISSNAISIAKTGYWYQDFEYSIERERGFDFREDLFQPFVLNFVLADPAAVIASDERRNTDEIKSIEKSELKRRAALVAKVKAKDQFVRQLLLAADQFVVGRGKGNTVIAGYHWFSDWGRDTMIALPGLTLATGRPEIAKSILAQFSEHISEGMIPNRFPDEGEEPEYNTVDATLWLFEAVRAYLEKSGDERFVREVLYDKLVDIIDWHVRGTRHKIHVDTDGLLYAGEPRVQLTWMDAKVGDWVVTPRTGKAVEIQALWYNALRIMADLASRIGQSERSAKYSEMAEVARASFNGQFWNAESECLIDVVDGDEKDASIRPNQIFAVSLHHSMLDQERARKVVQNVERDLLTSVGLRSLSPDDPRYVPVYIGSPLERDSAYHQGTVWAWLIGPFVEAYRKTHSEDSDFAEKIEAFTGGFREHLNEAMLGQVSEIFDADPPHTPRGCAAQAWSVAELLRTCAITDSDPP